MMNGGNREGKQSGGEDVNVGVSSRSKRIQEEAGWEGGDDSHKTLEQGRGSGKRTGDRRGLTETRQGYEG